MGATGDWLAINRAYWDERVPIHRQGRFYDVDGFKAGRSTLTRQEVADLAPVSGKTLLHLQCHFGLDTLSWARLGATVVGLDFSRPAIEAARALGAEAGIAAEFVEGNVYDAPLLLLGRSFDVVYTGIGALMWLPDIKAWAEVVAQLLVPGGELYLLEFHPTQWMLSETDPLKIVDGYFTAESGFAVTLPGSYADRAAATRANETRQWNHGLGAVVTALVAAGPTIQSLSESPDCVLQWWPVLERRETGLFRMPAESAVASAPLYPARNETDRALKKRYISRAGGGLFKRRRTSSSCSSVW